jgi:eukaryotic-like serine/threonine-protein kinase
MGRLLDGRYRVDGRIAVGGMATVYRAVDTRLDRLLALKVMHPGLACDPDFVERFIREAKAVARLDHPNVVGVYDQGTDGTYVFLAMEYVAGCTLRDVLRERGALTPRAALDILEPVLAALGAAHRSGLVHRDVKPENVLIGDDGRVKVADFGLVRAVDTATSNTTMGSVLGTVSYLSPEQIEHGTVDARSDVYACGVLLHEVLTGSKPHQGGTAMQVLYKHLNEDIPAPSRALPGLARELDDLVARAAARDPGRRPADAIELLALLQATRRALAPHQLDLAVPAARPPATEDSTTRLPRAAARVPVENAAQQNPAHQTSAQQTSAQQTSVRQTSVPRNGAGRAGADGTGATRAVPAGEPENRTSRLQLPPEFAQRAAGPADHPQSPPPPPSPLRTRRGLVGLLSVLALILCVGGAAWFIVEGRYTTTPSVLSLPRAAAQARLDKAGLKARFTQEFSEVIPVGKVVSTSPANGKRIRKGGTVTVALSKGPEQIAVPDLKGHTLARAKQELRQARLTAGTQKPAFSDEVPKGHVIRTDPAAGTRIRPSAPVTIVVSKGAPTDVPPLIGMTLDEARQALQDAGLELRTAAGEVFSDDVDEGSIARQSPADGITTAKGSTVTVTISKGPQLFPVPGVRGMKEDKAREKLEAAGFKVDVTDTLPIFGNDRVWRQSPGAGSKQPKGTTISLWVK